MKAEFVALAPTSNPIQLSPVIGRRDESLSQSSDDDEINDSAGLSKPKISMLSDVEDDSFQAPPRLSAALEDDTETQMSIEIPRRAFNNQTLGRDSKGSTRISDRFGNISELELDFSPASRHGREFSSPVQYEELDAPNHQG